MTANRIPAIINVQQSAMLAALVSQKTAMTNEQIEQATGFSKQKCWAHMSCLRERELVSVTRGDKSKFFYAITDSGRLALKSYQDKQQQARIVLPARISWRDQPVLVIGTGGYCRNESNAQTQSRGVSC